MSNVDFDEGLVRSLLRDQHPDLADLDLQRVAGGWDNQMWRLGAELAVRLPRTPRAPDLLHNELQWLPILAPRLPLPVPIPVRIGEPSQQFSKPWTIATWVPGEPGDHTAIRRSRHAAETLGEFLRALHRPAPATARANPTRGVPLSTLAHELDIKFPAIAVSAASADIRAVWNDAVAAPEWDGPPIWLHGDLHPANVVISDGTLSGVIDFGELCAGDPATDLAAAWLLLPDGAAESFFDAYATVDQATVRRARGWALLSAISLIDIGLAWERGLPGGQQTWAAVGRAAVERVLAYSVKASRAR